MPEVRLDVYADTHGAPTELKKTEAALDGVGRSGDSAHGKLGGLWKQFAVGNLASDALKKGLSFLKNEVLGSVTSAMESENAQRALASALATTGRSVEGMLPGLTAYASQTQKDTIYTDEQALSVMTLLAQLTDLDENGLKRAANGALGMATVLKMDLDTATRGVTQAMEGNYNLIGRYLPQLRTLKTEEEKHALVMQTLDTWYLRAKDETDTFAGSLKQLGNMWDEIKEAVGRAVTENETVKELIAKIKAGIVDLIESGKLKEWVDSVADSVTALINILSGLYKGIKAVVDLADKLPSIAKANKKFYDDTMSYVDKLAAEGKAKAEEFKDSLKVLDIPLEHLREEMEKGEGNWTRYTGEMKALDDAMAANRGTAELWVKKIADFLDVGEKAPAKVSDITAAIKAFKQETGVTVTTQDELKARLEKLTAFWETYGRSLPVDSQNKIKKAIQEAKAELYGMPTKIEIVDEFKRAAPITAELRTRIDELCRSYEFTLPPARDLMGIIRRAPAEFHDTAIGAWDFEGALADIADQAMVSENTVLQFLWNVRAEFLATMGIMIPKWGDFSAAAGTATVETKNYFDGLYNDIASGFGDSASGLIGDICNGMDFANGKFWETGVNFKKYFSEAFDEVKTAFFRMIGEIVADKVLGIFKSFFSDVKNTAKDTIGDVGKSLSGATSGWATGIGAAVGSFLGTVLAGILAGGPSGHQQEQQIKDTKDSRNFLADLNNFMLGTVKPWFATTDSALGGYFIKFDGLKASVDLTRDKTVPLLEKIRDYTSALKDLKSAQTGFEGRTLGPTLFLTHAGEDVKITPPAARAQTSGVSRVEAHVHIKPLLIKRDDGYLIDFVEEKVEYVRKQYERGNWTMPITSVRGA